MRFVRRASLCVCAVRARREDDAHAFAALVASDAVQAPLGSKMFFSFRVLSFILLMPEDVQRWQQKDKATLWWKTKTNLSKYRSSVQTSCWRSLTESGWRALRVRPAPSASASWY